MKNRSPIRRAPSGEAQSPASIPEQGFERTAKVTVWAGKGHDDPCHYCQTLIAEDEIDYEVAPIASESSRSLHFHIHCFEAWRASEE